MFISTDDRPPDPAPGADPASARHTALGMMAHALHILDGTGPHHAAATLSRAIDVAGGAARAPRP